ncbi:hypothetical protein RHSIM_Rhsim03G0233700 [Rhododendron simsii]|uniref:Uncharacterized protein n=1 Tax=Rhododendron simsii TaxID=118357 RepID=A0A834H9F9_RHOSS|nr:hypothetical protein RHSIM_Rhsim03G0233700 [Rhododendron simsii]
MRDLGVFHAISGVFFRVTSLTLSGLRFILEAIEMEVPTPPEVLNRPTAALPRSEFLTRQEVLKRARATGQGVRRPLLVHDGECQDQVQGVLLGVRLPGEVSILTGFLLFVSACFFSSIIISYFLFHPAPLGIQPTIQ